MLHSSEDAILSEGLQVYTQEQSRVQLALKERFHALWETPLEDVDLEEDLAMGDQEFDLESDEGSDGEGDMLDGTLIDHEETDNEA